MAQESSIGNLLTLLQAFSGKSGTTTTTGGTSTKQTVLDQNTLNAIMKSALEGNQGLANVASGQRAAGMYDSTVNTQLTNDLLSRLATQTTVAGAPTVTTTPKTTVATASPGLGLSGVAAIGALSLGKNLLDSELGTKGKKSLWDLLGGDKSATPSEAYDTGLGASIDSLGTGALAASGGAVPLDAVSGADLISSFGEAAWTAGDYEIGDALGAVDLGEAAEDISDVGSEVFSDSVGDQTSSIFDDCFLTTAVCEFQGKPDNCYELTVLRNFRDTWLKENFPEDIDTYYAEAPAIVEKIKALPTSAWIFDRMYSRYILPAIEHIEEGNHMAAYRIYKQLFRFCESL